jgi:hypothetical protein
MKRNKAAIVVVLAITLLSLSVSYSQIKKDVVYLKSGGKAIGHILEKDQGKPVVLQLQDDKTMEINWDDIKEVGEMNVANNAGPVSSESSEMQQPQPAHNALYVEGIGAGLLYSINYERFVKDNLSVRVGFSSWSFSFLDHYDFVGIPVMANYLIGSGSSKLNLGLGFEYIRIKYTGTFSGAMANIFSNDATVPTQTVSGVVLIGSLGYRYQPIDGGFHFQAGVVPIVSTHGARILPEISLGACF